MNRPENVPERLQELLDDHLDGRLDEAGVQELEALLRADAAARRHFVRYAGLHTNLRLEVRGRLAGARALYRIEQLVWNPATVSKRHGRALLRLRALLLESGLGESAP
jgi:anti-sigma factor RsiW